MNLLHFLLTKLKLNMLFYWVIDMFQLEMDNINYFQISTILVHKMVDGQLDGKGIMVMIIGQES